MWEVIGYVISKDDDGANKGVSIHVVKPYKKGDGEGKRCRTYWYRWTDSCYVPIVGDKVHIDVEVRGKYEVVTDIYK